MNSLRKQQRTPRKLSQEPGPLKMVLSSSPSETRSIFSSERVRRSLSASQAVKKKVKATFATVLVRGGVADRRSNAIPVCSHGCA